LDSLRTKNIPFIQADLGNFCSTHANVDVVLNGFIWDTMEELEVDVTTPGPREFQYWDAYSEMIARGTIPVVSSNIALVEDGKETPIGQEYLIIERNGVKVAFFGLMGGGQFSGAKIPEGVEFAFADPFQTAADLVPKLQKEADLVVLLSQMSTSDTQQLVKQVEGIDAALFGHLAPWVERCARVSGDKGTVLNQTGTRGQYLGHLVMIVDPDGNMIDYGSKNVLMDKAIDQDPVLAESVAAIEEQTKQLRADARKVRRTDAKKAGE
jgi:2',3'-cyclic-nucleotide 2'-phosphodiesterase (5'-nucleotidase family)